MTAENRTDSEAGPATAPDGATDPASLMAAFWSQWMEQSSRGTQALLEAVQSADPAKVQARFLESAAENLDAFMRTPPFLEMMRRNLKAMTDLKVMQDQFVEAAARQVGLPLADDITGLFERLNSTEQKILARLDAIERRLDALAEGNGPRRRAPKSSS